jgi:hypothetical protein
MKIKYLDDFSQPHKAGILSSNVEKAMIAHFGPNFYSRQLAFMGCSLLSLIYFPLAQRAFWVFNCYEPPAANVAFMSLTPWIACQSQNHERMKLGAGYLLIVFVVPSPHKQQTTSMPDPPSPLSLKTRVHDPK